MSEGKRKPLIWVLLIVVPAVAGGAFGTLAGSKAAKQAAAAEAEEHPLDEHGEPATPAVTSHSVVYEPRELIVNLAETRGQRYLKLRLALQLASEQPEEAKARLEDLQPQLRDRLIRLLSSKSIERVEDWGAKESIKLEILDIVNRSVFADGLATVEQVFFMEFLIQ